MSYELLSEKEGKCPYCSSKDLKYGTFGIDGKNGFFETDCNKCGKHFHEVYKLTFIGNCGEEIQ